MLAAKAKEQEDKILDFEEKRTQDQSLQDEIELYQKQVESIKEELKVPRWINILLSIIRCQSLFGTIV